MKVDAGALLETSGGWDGDVDGAVEWFQEAPEDGGGAVTKDRGLAAGENGGHEATVEAQTSVSNRVDALVHAVKTTAL